MKSLMLMTLATFSTLGGGAGLVCPQAAIDGSDSVPDACDTRVLS